MIVKSKTDPNHLTNLMEVVVEVRKNSMRLNSEKCTFGIRAGKFLRLYLTERGIEANPNKCTTKSKMRPPTTKKEIRKLIGMIAALSRFISKAANKSLPLLKILGKEAQFEWTTK